ncbi:hypothetical protein PIROE2DRAFT_58921 [Piromyces sp. E2]|nr:hypothetical protein PIROE2DRAFT_58921 [Piromyces sp. E2]|eukprot:OUM67152.1 hypothetical protein PIROE2DRAFT_58921 [Piromyces sp. E2]
MLGLLFIFINYLYFTYGSELNNNFINIIPTPVNKIFNDTTGYPDANGVFRPITYIPENKIFDYKEIAESYLDNEFGDCNYQFLRSSKLKNSDIVTNRFSQIINNVSIINSYALININSNNGLIIDYKVSIFPEITYVEKIPNDMDEFIFTTIDKLGDYLKINYENKNYNIVYDDKSNIYEVGNVFFSDDKSVRVKLLYSVVDNKALTILMFSFKFNNIYNNYFYSKKSDNFYQLQNINGLEFNAIPITKNDILDGPELMDIPDTIRWIQSKDIYYQVTIGNNVRVALSYNMTDKYCSISNLCSTTSYAENGYTYTQKYDPSKSINDNNNISFILNNIFYVTNMLHDIYEWAGFDEYQNNFQNYYYKRRCYSNFGYVRVFLDHTLSNISFSQIDSLYPIPQITLGYYNRTGEERSSGLDNSVIIHEYSHLVYETATRMANEHAGHPVFCNYGFIPIGIQEGTVDFFAELFQYKKSNNRNDPYTVGKYVNAIRAVPITSDMSINNLKYSDIRYRGGMEYEKETNNDNYFFGNVWATMLHEALYNLCDEHECEEITKENLKKYENAKTPPYNYILITILVQALLLDHCILDVLSFRNRILEVIPYNKFSVENDELDIYCRIYAAFAKRGLGHHAYEMDIDFENPEYIVGEDNFDLPPDCTSYYYLLN